MSASFAPRMLPADRGPLAPIPRAMPLAQAAPLAQGAPIAPRSSGGFALVPALFLIVVLGVLAVVAVRLGTAQSQAVIMSLAEARALAAAQAGIEWGAYQSLDNGSCAASTTLNLNEAALAGYTVTVTCSATTFSNGTATASSFVLLSTATLGTYGQPGYVRRTVSGTYTNAT